MHTVALTNFGKLLQWGSYTRMENKQTVTGKLYHPQKVLGVDEIIFNSIAAGGDHSLAISEFGEVYTWGDGSNGQLGLTEDVVHT